MPTPPPSSSPKSSSPTLVSSEDAALLQEQEQRQQNNQSENENNSPANTPPFTPHDASSTTLVDSHHRRRSIQFNVANTDAQLRQRPPSVKKKLRKSQSRLPSPPPPSAYSRGVSFDTFDNRDAPDFALTLNYKHRDYHSTRRSRTFLCGTDQNDYSDFALEWLIDELVDDGDEIVCLRVVEKDSKIASDSSVEEGKYRMEAEKLFESVVAKNNSGNGSGQDEKAISLVMELAVGKVQEIIQRMIQIYEPAVLIVGTRGRSLGGMQGLLPGSVSKYCLQQSPIPVIVVRPSSKREKKKQKRLADPSRRSYNHILQMSGSRGGSLFDKAESKAESGDSTKVQEEEAAAVAQAIGLPPYPEVHHGPRDSRSSFSRDSTRSSEGFYNEDDEESERRRSDSSVPNPESPRMSSVVMKSPEFRNLDSPDVSDEEAEGEGEEPLKGGNDEDGKTLAQEAVAPAVDVPEKEKEKEKENVAVVDITGQDV